MFIVTLPSEQEKDTITYISISDGVCFYIQVYTPNDELHI